jgi:AAA ATPase-like protein/nuclease-like protein
MIPEQPAEDCESRAERRLFDRIRDSLDDDFVALHSVAWLLPGKKGKPEQGEADFVLAHPERGILALEVKGGSIQFDAAQGKWFSIGKSGENPIKDPFRQVQNATHSLRRVLERSKRVSDERFSVGYGVSFPDTRMKTARLKLDAPREIVIDGDDLRGLGPKLEQVFTYWRSDPPGIEGVEHLERVLANSFELRAPLAVELAEEERELYRLTEQQYKVLDLLSRQPRAAIAGCAGSGKTFLAAEKARRLERQGFKVLVLCFNTLLAQHLRRGLADVDEVDACSFDELCYRVIKEAGIDFPGRPTPGEEGVYYKRLRDTFADCVLEVAAGRYGALVVDEAQDFHPDWWTPLQLLLEDPDKSPLYVFYDDNQRIFPVPEGLPIDTPPFPLTVNCRNTKTINSLVTSYYEGSTIQAQGPQGIPIERHFYKTDGELLKQLDESVRNWVESGEVDPGQIALLTARSSERSALWSVESLGGVQLTDDPWEKGRILRSSIGRFKGLERQVVGVAEIDGVADKVLYIGFSRPSLFLSVFCHEDARRRLPRQLAA